MVKISSRVVLDDTGSRGRLGVRMFDELVDHLGRQQLLERDHDAALDARGPDRVGSLRCRASGWPARSIVGRRPRGRRPAGGHERRRGRRRRR